MKKSVLTIVVLLLLIIIVTIIVPSCISNKQKNDETSLNIETKLLETDESFLSIETEMPKIEYEIYAYNGGEGGAYVSSEYNSVKELFISNFSTKEGVKKKNIEIFDEECSFVYSRTVDFGLYDESYDNFGSSKCLIQIGEKTGRIGSFSHGNPQNVKFNCTPPVNEHSSSQEFVDYAREVLSKYSGISTDDCDIEIKTTNIHTTYKYTNEELNQGFVNFIDYDPSFSAEYKIIFYKKFGGLNRIDDISVTIKNDGTVMYFRGRICDEKFKKFSNIKIDEELIMEMVNNFFDGSTSSLDELERTETQLSVVPNGNNLWIFASVYYKYTNYGERFGGVVQCLIRVL